MQQKANSIILESTLNQSNISNDFVINVKFPTNSIQTFSGNYEECIASKNCFTSLIESKKKSY